MVSKRTELIKKLVDLISEVKTRSVNIDNKSNRVRLRIYSWALFSLLSNDNDLKVAENVIEHSFNTYITYHKQSEKYYYDTYNAFRAILDIYSEVLNGNNNT